MSVNSCELIVRRGYPDNAEICGRVPMAVCAGCEMELCRVHLENCPDCKADLCEGCLYLHEEMHKEAKDIIQVLGDELTRLRAEVTAYKATVRA